MIAPRDHGGGLDAAIARYGGTRADWLDLSTGINPVPYPLPPLPTDAWTALPDRQAMDRLLTAARQFWSVPDAAAILAAPGASALIARIPYLANPARVHIPGPTYNEHAAAFRQAGWQISEGAAEDARPPISDGRQAESAQTPNPDGRQAEGPAQAIVLVHPNNPDGRQAAQTQNPDDRQVEGRPTPPLTIIDESFCDTLPGASLIAHSTRPGTIILKSFGKFWGLAGLRLGFAIGDPHLIKALTEMLGPWPVAGPALAIGAAALEDQSWAEETRGRLTQDAARLDRLMSRTPCIGGTSLFRLYDTEDAAAWQERLAQHKIWSRIFPYSTRWLRLGLPPPDRWRQLESAL